MTNIQRATDAHLTAICTWLEDEKARGIEGNFLCNWNIIAREQKERGLVVSIDPVTSRPIAVQSGGLLRGGILAVRAEFLSQIQQARGPSAAL